MGNEQSNKNKIYKYINIGLIVVVLLLWGNKIYTIGGRSTASGNDGLSKLAIEYYIEQTGGASKEGLEASVKNFGCHKEIHVFKDGELVMRTSFSGGQIYQID